MSTREKLTKQRDQLVAEARTLADSVSPTPADLERMTEIKDEVAQVNTRIGILDIAAHHRNIEVGEDTGVSFVGEDRGVPQHMRRTNTDVDIRTAGRPEIRSAASAVLEREKKLQHVPISDGTAAHLEAMFGRMAADDDGNVMFDGDKLARRFLATETPAYRTAWQKALQGPNPAWTTDEVEAVNYFRVAEQSLTNASGGYGVPVSLDPTIIITSGAQVAPLLSVSRIEPITSNVWKGVSSEGVTFAAHSEGAAVSAQQATLAQPSITPETAAAFIPFSVEIGGDFPNFAAEFAGLIEQAYIDYLAKETAVGAAGVIGIFPALDAVVASELTPTTDGMLGPVDAIKVFNALPERSRSRGTWFSHVTVESQMRNASAVSGLYTTDMSTAGIGPLLGHEYLVSDYAPAFTGTTGASNLAVFGDFRQYVIVPRVGMSIELIPHVFDSDGLPKLQRGYLAWARTGADVVMANAFRLLQNA